MANLLAQELRDRAWLEQFVTRPIPDTARNLRYKALLNRACDERYLGLDTDWFNQGGGGYISRAQTNDLGRLAFFYRTPGFKYYHDPKVLEKIRLAFEGVVKFVSEQGKFTWTEKLNEYGYDGEVHEHGWRVEPLLLAYLWVGRELPAELQPRVEAALLRASTWLATHPLLQHNNRGAVWCATTTLAGVFFGRKDFLDTVEKNADAIVQSVVNEDGESGEHTAQYGGGGPDANYSYTGWSYVYLYRVLSGRSALDERLLGALRWFAAYNTLSGCPVASGASVRRRYANPDNFKDLLPALERYSHSDPFFGTLAVLALDKLELEAADGPENIAHISAGHMLSPLIWALLEQGLEAPAAGVPAWRAGFTKIYERPEVHYALIGREYQTGVTLRGRTAKGYFFPLRGLQTFAYGSEFPILLHSDERNSTTLADGLDTAVLNAEKGLRGWEVLWTPGAKRGSAPGELGALLTRRKHLWTLYAFTPVSALEVTGGAQGAITSRWVMNRQFVSTPRLEPAARRVTFEGRQGTLQFLKGDGVIKSEQLKSGDNATEVVNMRVDTLETTAPAPLQAFAFSNASFHFGGYDEAKEELSFADGSGRYVVALKGVLAADGNLDRAAAMRLTARSP